MSPTVTQHLVSYQEDNIQGHSEHMHSRQVDVATGGGDISVDFISYFIFYIFHL